MKLTIEQTTDAQTGVVLRTRLVITPESEGETSVLESAALDCAAVKTFGLEMSFAGDLHGQWSKKP